MCKYLIDMVLRSGRSECPFAKGTERLQIFARKQ